MYLEFYGLSEKPFSQTPDPRFLYWNDAYRETLASLSYGIRERKGFIAMLGEAGTGKTTLLRKLLDDLGDDIVSVFLFNPNATFEEILEYTLSELGIACPNGRKLAMLQRLNEFLLAAYSEGRNTILLIDEAQDLDRDVLESLRLLSNLETSDDKILQIVLSGQPELAEKLADPSLRQLKQRIAVRCRLEPLREEELPNYLSARLAVAGGSPDLFDPETLPAIWEFATGIPRIVNTVCDNALLLGYALGKRTIDSEVIGEVIADLRKIDVDGWITPTATAPAAPAPEAPQAQSEPTLEPEAMPAPPAASEPAPRISSAARPPQGRSGSLGWMTAAVLTGLVLLLAGAWLGRVGPPDFGPTEPPPSAARQAEPDPVQLGGTAVATAATRLPDTPEALEPAPGIAADTRGVAPAEPAAPTLRGSHDDGTTAEARQPAPDAGAADIDRAPIPSEEAPRARPAEPELPTTTRLAAIEAALAEGGRVPVERADEPAPPRPETDAGEPAADRNQVAPPDEPEARGAQADSPTRNAPPPRATISVAPGDTLLELAARRYGGSNLTTLDMLRAVNPKIRDVDMIIAGSGLNFPDPGPQSRVLPDGSGFAVLAMTTYTLSRALAVQSSLEEELDRPVALERIAGRDRPSAFRVSVRGLSDRDDATAIAEQLGPILKDPAP